VPYFFVFRNPYSWFHAILFYSFLFSLFDAAKVAKISNNYGVYSSILRYFFLLECLLACGSLKSAFDYYSRASRIFPGDLQLVSIQEKLEHKLRSHFESRKHHLGSERHPRRRLSGTWICFVESCILGTAMSQIGFSAESIQFSQ